MTCAVVEIGPQTVRGPDPVPPEWCSVAIQCVDDQIALLDGRVVAVGRLWRDLLEAAVGGPARTLVLVLPSWWSSSRIELITRAAANLAAESVVLQRISVLRTGGDITLVELSEEFVVIAAPGAELRVLVRGSRDVAEFLRSATAVLIDVPAGVQPLMPAPIPGWAPAYSDRQQLMGAVSAWLAARRPPQPDYGRLHAGRRVAGLLAGALLAVAALGGGWVVWNHSAAPPPDAATSLLAEGRVVVRVPDGWAIERITSGPGSARVRVAAPMEATALHITQSAGTDPATLDEIAEILRSAVESERPGVFVDLNPADTLGGRAAVTYRELRSDSETSWAVVVDGVIRIAIGCQSPPGRYEVIRDACVRAVQSAQVPR
ncbi:MAG: type VII secretion-associated protein [Mycolicibacterium sp.]|uniref:type VII secretion-associated protein n=1 Tax=Mycolicibacterium sp. TaxID=2320850 RepID=UPI003D121C7B